MIKTQDILYDIVDKLESFHPDLCPKKVSIAWFNRNTEHPALKVVVEGMGGLSVAVDVEFGYQYPKQGNPNKLPSEYTTEEIVAFAVNLLLEEATKKCDKLKDMLSQEVIRVARQS